MAYDQIPQGDSSRSIDVTHTLLMEMHLEGWTAKMISKSIWQIRAGHTGEYIQFLKHLAKVLKPCPNRV